MKIGIIHIDFSALGGGEKVAFDFYNVLKEDGHNPFFITYTQLDNYDFIKIRHKSLLSKMLIYKSVYLKLLLNVKYALEEANKLKSKNMIIASTNIDYPVNIDIQYIQNPVFYMQFRKQDGIVRKVYNKIVNKVENDLKGTPSKIIYNSNFTKIKNKLDGRVVYPNAFDTYYLSNYKARKKFVVTLTRLEYDKNIHKIKDIAKYFYNDKDVKFIIIGRSQKTTEKVIKEFERDKECYLYISKGNSYSDPFLVLNPIHIYKDADKFFIKNIMEKSLVYLHPPFQEPFGISVVEGITAGLIPVVYRDSGSCMDIVSKIDDRLCYDNLNEAVEIINKIFNGNFDLEKIRKRGLDVVKQFNYENFKKGIINALNNL